MPAKNLKTIRMTHETASAVVINESDRAAYEAQGFKFESNVAAGDKVHTAGDAAASAAKATAAGAPTTGGEGGGGSGGSTSDAPHGGDKAQTVDSYPYDKHSKPELVAMAGTLGVPVGDGATKADIIVMLKGAGFVPGVDAAGKPST